MAGEIELLTTRDLTYVIGHDVNGLAGRYSLGLSTPGMLTSTRLNAGNGLARTFSGTFSATNSAFWSLSNWTGSSTGETPLNRIAVNGDAIAAQTTQYVEALQVYHSFGGGAAVGGRHALVVYLNQNAATGNYAATGGVTPSSPYNVGLNIFVDASFNEGGTGTGFSTCYGNFFAFNPVVRTHTGATNIKDVVNTEFNILCQAGSSMYSKVGIQIVKETGDAVQGAQKDAAFIIADQSSTVGWKNGVQLGSWTANWPFDTATGTLIGSQVSQGYPITTVNLAAYGVDLLQTSFVGAAFRSYGFSVDGSGNTQIGAGILKPASTGLQIDCQGSVGTAAAVQSGGSNYSVGDVLLDAYGGVYRVATLSGSAVATVTILVAPYYNSHSTPANPVSTTLATSGTPIGSGCALNLTWDTTRTALDLNPSGGDVRAGSASALNTNSTDGFLKIPTMAGTPSGNTGTGRAAIVYDTSANKLWVGINGTWKSAAFA